MQFNVVFIATALVASASLAMSATITVFAAAGCTGLLGPTFSVSSGECFDLGGIQPAVAKSIRYSGVPSEIEFFISDDEHDFCTHGPSLVLGGSSGCATAPAGVNWESVAVF